MVTVTPAAALVPITSVVKIPSIPSFLFMSRTLSCPVETTPDKRSQVNAVRQCDLPLIPAQSGQSDRRYSTMMRRRGRADVWLGPAAMSQAASRMTPKDAGALQPLRYSPERPFVEPDWRRLPGYRSVTSTEWESALWQRRHTVKNLKQLKAALGAFARGELL